MIITGKKRWAALMVVSFLAGIMVYVPYLRFSYYDQMVMLFSQSTNIADAAHVNEFIGNFTLIEAIVCTIGYPIGGYITDKFSEKRLLIAGGLIMGACSIWFGFLTSAMSIYIINFLYGIGVVLIFSPFLKVTRKLGTAKEQGTMFSMAEFFRAITGTALGFIAVAILNGAVIGGTMDPVILAEKWKIALCLDGIMFFIFCLGLFFLLPDNLRGAETEGMEVEESNDKITVAGVIAVMKMPGTWMMALLIFFAYSFVACGSGYLGTYSVRVIGISETTASNFAIVRNYILGAASTLIIGFVADKIGFKVKTLGIYLAAASILTAILMVFGAASPMIGLVISAVFAFVFMGMKGIYFATMEELGIPLELSGVCTGVVSFFAYLPDVYFAKIAGIWLDKYGNTGFTYIWLWAIGCGVLGILTAVVATRYAKKLQYEK